MTLVTQKPQPGTFLRRFQRVHPHWSQTPLGYLLRHPAGAPLATGAGTGAGGGVAAGAATRAAGAGCGTGGAGGDETTGGGGETTGAPCGAGVGAATCPICGKPRRAAAS